MKKIFFAVAVLAVVLITGGCTKLLLSEPRGEYASQEQVDSNIDALKSSLAGLYSIMYYGSDQREVEEQSLPMIDGQKYIDVMSDLLASDAASPNNRYGWIATRTYMNEYLPTSRYNNWLWKYEYNNIRNANMLIRRCDNFLKDASTKESLKEEIEVIKAQAIIMRTHFYSNLFNLYEKPGDTSGQYGVIYYDENNMDTVQGLSNYNDMIRKIIDNTTSSIDKIKKLENNSKVGLDVNIAKMILAYIHLNRGRYFDETAKTESCNEALRLAKEVIEATKTSNPILPYAEVLTNGFNNINSKNWMWGVDVTSEKTYYLYCFFSFVDIYTYSYASAGDYIALDKGLFDNLAQMLDEKDKRKEWWNDVNIIGGGSFYCIANNKFFDKDKVFQGDRDWDNDYVFMRSEEAYLIAAEAAYALGNEAEAKTYLKELVTQRSPDNVTAIDALTGDKLSDYIAANWRIEMWLEGKSLMAFKRFKWTHKRGANHFYHAGKELKATDIEFTYQIPTGETNYNPKL